jgi:hypothetical protein
MVDTSSFISEYTADANSMSIDITIFIIVVIITLIWKLIWYGMALFKAIERKQIRWFTILFACLILNDLGILAIIYLWVYKEKDKPGKQAKRKR